MESARHTLVQLSSNPVVNVSADLANVTDVMSHVQSNELLRQLSELVDGLMDLSAPFKYSSVSSSDAWATPLDYTDKSLAVTGSRREPSERNLLSR
jgi:hypothetical protein